MNQHYEICEEPPLFITEAQEQYPEFAKKFNVEKIKAYKMLCSENVSEYEVPNQLGIAYWPQNLSLAALIALAETAKLPSALHYIRAVSATTLFTPITVTRSKSFAENEWGENNLDDRIVNYLYKNLEIDLRYISSELDSDGELQIDLVKKEKFEKESYLPVAWQKAQRAWIDHGTVTSDEALQRCIAQGRMSAMSEACKEALLMAYPKS